MNDFSDKKVAIVADWLIDFGGAELVIQELLEMFPQAEIFTSVCFMKHPMLEGRKIHTSFIQKIPFLNRKHKLAGLLRPWAFRRFDLSDFDLVICSCSAESKNVALGPHSFRSAPSSLQNRERNSKGFFGKIFQKQRMRDDEDFQNSQKQENHNENKEKIFQKQEMGGDENFSQNFQNSQKQENHNENEQKNTLPSPSGRGVGGEVPKVFVYCHTPIRYYWSHFEEYKNMMEFGIFNPIAKWIFPKVVNYMRKLDYEASQAVDVFWANSKTTAERIKKFYHRDAEILYPGIDAKNFSPSDEKKDFYFGIGRCIPYKKFDLMVDAFNQNGKPLVLATNTDNLLYRELKGKSKENIKWIFSPSNEERKQLYAQAKAFLFPPEEDFGLVPVEAMISGTPVIAYGVGGGTETIVDGKTGVFFTPQTPEGLNEAIEKFEKMHLKKEDIIARGHEFSTKNFRKNLLESLHKHFGNE